MIIEVFADDIKKNDINNRVFHSSRAIIVKNNQVLLLYSSQLNYYMLPGGRIENSETPEECIVREVKEETGYEVVIDQKTLIIKEYYQDSTWESHFFKVLISESKRKKINLTQEEIDLKITYKWFDFDEALQVLDNHDTDFPKGYNIMQRDFLALINSI
ncbi:MAG: NUDIX hydrolase [Candidatus Izimaplasma sp.]|nr:NUDIX hydrolase [Candidatus Izimaplasma bacterium]